MEDICEAGNGWAPPCPTWLLTRAAESSSEITIGCLQLLVVLRKISCEGQQLLHHHLRDGEDKNLPSLQDLLNREQKYFFSFTIMIPPNRRALFVPGTVVKVCLVRPL